MTPEEIAHHIAWHETTYKSNGINEPDVLDCDALATVIAAALRAYGDERAQEIIDAYQKSSAFQIGSAVINAKSPVRENPDDARKTAIS